MLGKPENLFLQKTRNNIRLSAKCQAISSGFHFLSYYLNHILEAASFKFMLYFLAVGLFHLKRIFSYSRNFFLESLVYSCMGCHFNICQNLGFFMPDFYSIIKLWFSSLHPPGPRVKWESLTCLKNWTDYEIHHR